MMLMKCGRSMSVIAGKPTEKEREREFFFLLPVHVYIHLSLEQS